MKSDLDFNKLFGRIRDIDQGKQTVKESVVKECGPMMDMGQMGAPSSPPMSMSVNLNAQGIDQIKDLLGLMTKADSPLAPGPVGMTPPMDMGPDMMEPPKDMGPDMMEPPMDMPEPMDMPSVGGAGPLSIQSPAKKEPAPEMPGGEDPLAAIMRSAGLPEKPKAPEAPTPPDTGEKPEEPADDEGPTPGTAPSSGKPPEGKEPLFGKKEPEDDKPEKEGAGGFDNATTKPSPSVSGVDSVTATGTDMHSKGDEAPKKNGGGNPMESSIKSSLMKLYQEIKEGK
jgi:hypothetical protein